MMLQKREKGTLNPNIIMTFAVFGSSQFFWLALPLSEGMTVMGGERKVGFMFEGNKKRPWKLKRNVLLSSDVLFATMAR